jgi:phage baseplate assembly protein W
MSDVSHYYGSNISAGPTGDLLPSNGTVKGEQRVLRRLLTNPGEYIWHPEYGAGLPQFIGLPERTDQIKAVIQQQVLLEAAVAQIPPPTVGVTFRPDGTFFVAISYTDTLTGSQRLLQFSVSN